MYYILSVSLPGHIYMYVCILGVLIVCFVKPFKIVAQTTTAILLLYFIMFLLKNKKKLYWLLPPPFYTFSILGCLFICVSLVV